MQPNTKPITPPEFVATAYASAISACRNMVSAQHAGPITPEMYTAWTNAQRIVDEAANHAIPVVETITMLKEALHEAEDELCRLGAEIMNDGWDTWTIKLALDVIRIALYGGDGDGQGPEHFENARAALKAQRDKEQDDSKPQCLACEDTGYTGDPLTLEHFCTDCDAHSKKVGSP
ncbi:hypothetical protein ACFFU8_17980 [Chromobacterium piscinae]|uniref:hypothetical protein n=1 Tax=Chromobacterium piscinae TaxID=686831 RepID=UPI001E344B63|nr:hypothetical protein [Chromobacterium piscinae]MCD5326795.1 hypothetical protein [Chromobacterium piscinae]